MDESFQGSKVLIGSNSEQLGESSPTSSEAPGHSNITGSKRMQNHPSFHHPPSSPASFRPCIVTAIFQRTSLRT